MGTIVEAEKPVIGHCIHRDNGGLTKGGSNRSQRARLANALGMGSEGYTEINTSFSGFGLSS